MKFLQQTSLVVLGLLGASLLSMGSAQARPFTRVNVRGYNPSTGNVGAFTTRYNPATGTRRYRAGRYNPETNSYQRVKGAINPAAGQGYNSVTTYTPDSGVTKTINTLQKGSYTCTASAGSPASCSPQ